MGVIRSAIGDAVLTSMWVFSMPLLRIFTGIIATYLSVQAIPLADLLITINLVHSHGAQFQLSRHSVWRSQLQSHLHRLLLCRRPQAGLFPPVQGGQIPNSGGKWRGWRQGNLAGDASESGQSGPMLAQVVAHVKKKK
ncbi:hypothetical protein SLEP1_g53827 [Rubroshorea leprosula]|uniref:Uncharacterized protein n=1 Tax=Rubroshorea leprosula TaxID=152421 RepID=A0AAV5MAQ5_9ROSI|nr:hypothetical protein SLEP1_g53827 [Rubroshorea leprosula]